MNTYKSFTCSFELIEQVKNAAEKERKSVNKFIVEAIKEKIERDENKNENSKKRLYDDRYIGVYGWMVEDDEINTSKERLLAYAVISGYSMYTNTGAYVGTVESLAEYIGCDEEKVRKEVEAMQNDITIVECKVNAFGQALHGWTTDPDVRLRKIKMVKENEPCK